MSIINDKATAYVNKYNEGLSRGEARIQRSCSKFPMVTIIAEEGAQDGYFETEAKKYLNTTWTNMSSAIFACVSQSGFSGVLIDAARKFRSDNVNLAQMMINVLIDFTVCSSGFFSELFEAVSEIGNVYNISSEINVFCIIDYNERGSREALNDIISEKEKNREALESRNLVFSAYVINKDDDKNYYKTVIDTIILSNTDSNINDFKPFFGSHQHISLIEDNQYPLISVTSYRADSNTKKLYIRSLDEFSDQLIDYLRGEKKHGQELPQSMERLENYKLTNLCTEIKNRVFAATRAIINGVGYLRHENYQMSNMNSFDEFDERYFHGQLKRYADYNLERTEEVFNPEVYLKDFYADLVKCIEEYGLNDVLSSIDILKMDNYNSVIQSHISDSGDLAQEKLEEYYNKQVQIFISDTFIRAYREKLDDEDQCPALLMKKLLSIIERETENIKGEFKCADVICDKVAERTKAECENWRVGGVNTRGILIEKLLNKENGIYVQTTKDDYLTRLIDYFENNIIRQVIPDNRTYHDDINRNDIAGYCRYLKENIIYSTGDPQNIGNEELFAIIDSYSADEGNPGNEEIINTLGVSIGVITGGYQRLTLVGMKSVSPDHLNIAN